MGSKISKELVSGHSFVPNAFLCIENKEGKQ
jgi:hypothetical protein